MDATTADTAPESARLKEFAAGLIAVAPMVAGAAPFGLIFGAFAISVGLSPLAVIGMSLFVFAGSSQFIGATLWGQGAAPLLIIVTTLIVNARHALYSASLASYLKHLPQRWLIPLAHMLTDEAYAITITRFERAAERTENIHWFMFGAEMGLFVAWQTVTVIGIAAGQALMAGGGLGLDFAMSVTFIGMIVPMLRSRPMVACAITGGTLGLLLNGLPNKLGLLIAAFAAIAVGYVLETARGKSQVSA
ncbi:MAG: AzlC family ABC transporter permease [Chloroflexi bacterium]|jgi:4-azaleucine resistance transporter AzlC|nr:branched-chain amino acid ABC transporter permease [Chloroflexota bacterium]MBW7880267.1 AzlC family ABC transporter permease [Anaerolineae bacterium]MDL1916156.1 AzlC family ABC transporter permease [Anaerolineae bacterium CFX4]OQY86899.1 MAG: hypothetical protein B6D42_00225 [Anaerolineae bacterium UTCFX5]MCC6565376.1 AzlC family ABC transporter permease [Chloroflexota bacterium]